MSVAGDTRVALAIGRFAPIASLVGTTPAVAAVLRDGFLGPAVADRVWCVGRRRVFYVQMETTQFVRATADHRFHVEDGWKRVDELAVGNRLRRASVGRLIWEPIIAIQASSEDDVYDLTVPGAGCWIGNDFLGYGQ